MINYIYEFIKPVFEDLGILDYLMISYSDKADYQINSVFSIAKDMHKNPILIGEEIVNAVNGLDSFSDYFKEFSFVKPGFINIFVSDKLINKCFNEINLSVKKDLKEVFFIDYGGPNIAKPINIVN